MDSGRRERGRESTARERANARAGDLNRNTQRTDFADQNFNRHSRSNNWDGGTERWRDDGLRSRSDWRDRARVNRRPGYTNRE